MSEEFNWLDYAEPEESAPAPSPRRGLRRFLPRRPGLPRLPARPSLPALPGMPRLPRRPRLPRLSLPRRGTDDASLESPSAPDLLGLQDERPLEELDDRLRSLRERSAAGSPSEAESRQALYDVDEVLVSPEVLHKPGGVISAAALSKAQEQQVELLKDIVGGAGKAQETGGRRFLPSAGAFSLSAAPRLLGSALLCLMVSLPFVSSEFSEGQLPPSEFHEDRPGATNVYALLDSLTEDDYVLLAFEYGPAAAGELDAIADLFLRHIVAQRAKPLIVSSNPIAIVHAQNVIRGINRSVASSGNHLQRGRDYFILRYLPGGSLGLRELSENFADVARVSHKGELTGLEFDALADMAAIVLIAERAEDMRNWAEQVVAEAAETRLLAASSYAAAPLAQVYADSMDAIVGLVVGYRDAYTYGEKLQLNFGLLLPAGREPDVAPAAELAAKEEQTNEADAQVERRPATELPPPTELPSPTARSLPTTTPRPINTAPPTATNPPTVTATGPPTATATQETVRVVEVVSPRQVRIRRGPSTASDILQLALAGDMFELVGANDDASWYRIALSARLDGWIAEFLVEVKEATRAALQAAQASASARIPDERVFLRREFDVSLGKNRPRFYQVDIPTAGDIPEYVLQRDRSREAPRLHAMTFGTLAAVLMIALGNVYYALGALGRRRRAADNG